MPPSHPHRALHALGRLGLSGALSLLGAHAGLAGPAVAFDAHQATTAHGRTLRAATAVGVLAGPLGDLSVAITRLHDSSDGYATIVGAGTGLGLGSLLSVRAGLSHTDWQRAPDAWTVSVGPELRFAGNAFDARFSHTRQDGGRTVHGAAFDLEHPVAPRWALRAEASYAHGSDGTIARAFLGGANFGLLGPLHVIGEAGLAHDPYGVLTDSRGSEAGSPGLVGGILNGGPSAPGPSSPSQPSNALHPTALLGLRCVLP